MSFRKRNIGISDGRRPQGDASVSRSVPSRVAGTRPSPVDGRLVTSSGSTGLDGLFAGHRGIPLGTSVLLEERGTTDYAGALLRFYAAEGLLQGHVLHIVGLPEQWTRDLPGLATDSSRKRVENTSGSEMKIAWRYEKLNNSDLTPPGITQNPSTFSSNEPQQRPFPHTFDLSKRLVHPVGADIRHYPIDLRLGRNCWANIGSMLSAALGSSSHEVVHRLIIPSIMSPALYPTQSVLPEYVLGFQHVVKQLLARYPTRCTVMQTLPLSLYPRESGVTAWIEQVSDGVYEMTPFPHSADAEFNSPRDPATKEEHPQGLLSIHKLPVFHETGIGNIPADSDWTFALSRRKFAIKPFNLPPLEGDTEAQDQATSGPRAKSESTDF